MTIVLATQSAENASVVKDSLDDIEGQNNAAKIVALNADVGQRLTVEHKDKDITGTQNKDKDEESNRGEGWTIVTRKSSSSSRSTTP